MANQYEMDVMRQQIAALESAVNQLRKAAGLAEIQIPKPAQKFDR